MNKIEIMTLIRRSLRQHQGTQYGDISSMDTVMPCPAEPEPHLLLEAPDPLGEIRKYRITITEET